MKNKINTFLLKFSVEPKLIFLMDGIGALVSALLLLLLIMPLEPVFGMPRAVALSLSVPAFVFCGYSLVCYFAAIQNWRMYLTLIAIANGVYCCITLAYLVQYFTSVTLWGVLYFSGEILIILALVSLEVIIVRRSEL